MYSDMMIRMFARDMLNANVKKRTAQLTDANPTTIRMWLETEMLYQHELIKHIVEHYDVNGNVKGDYIVKSGE